MTDPFGVRTEELAGISKAWLGETLHINDMPWSAFEDATGAGSEVLAAIRDTGHQGDVVDCPQVLGHGGARRYLCRQRNGPR